MAEIPGGGTFWARQTIESKIFYDKPDKWFKIWFYLVSKVNHQDKKNFKRGQGFIKYEWIKSTTGATQDQVKHCIEYLKRFQMVAIQKATRGMYVTIIKYSHYQSLNNYKSHTESQLKATQKPHRSHTINKNDKNDKNDNKKDKYMDFVFLTKEEYNKLITRFGKDKSQGLIERLNNYVGSKGKKYQSHYHTILTWADKDNPQQPKSEWDKTREEFAKGKVKV